MLLGALLIAAALAVLVRESSTSRSLRILGLAALIIGAAEVILIFVPLPQSAEDELVWGLVEQEWLVWMGYAAGMVAMSLLGIAASKTAGSRVENIGWIAMIVGAAGQAFLILGDIYWWRVFGRLAISITAFMPIAIVLFGVAWIAIGIARMSSTGAQNRLQTAP
jgi:hypothetical protein